MSPTNGAKAEDESATATGQAAASPTKDTAKAAGSAQTGKQTGKGQAIEALKADHRKVEQLFAEYEKAEGGKKRELIEQVCKMLTLHTMLEEELFYPAFREKTDEADPLNEAQVEHDSAKVLIADLMSAADDDRFRDAKMRVLAEQIKHHVGEEEDSKDGIFAKAQAAGIDTPELAQQLQQRRAELEQRDRLPAGRPVAIQMQSNQTQDREEYEMASYQQRGQDRDDQGRFTSGGRGSNGGGNGNGGGGGSRGRSDYDDDRRSSGNRERDDDGRFTSSRGGRNGGGGGGGGGGGRGDDRGGSGDGRGWYGDSRGHSEAAQRGWDDRGSSRSSRDYDDNRGSSRGGSSRYDDDDRGGRSSGGGGRDGDGRGWYGDSRGHSEAARRGWDNPDHGDSGWYGDSRGHSEAARRGWDNPDHGPSGWFGDPEGHSEASRRGWDDRGGSSRSSRGRDYDDDRGGNSRSSRGRNDDDDDRGNGHGGWFGDSRGHAEAARRGWENRR